MKKVSLLKLKDSIDRRSTLLAIPGIMDYLDLSPINRGKTAVWLEIIEQAIQNFQYFRPPITHLKAHVTGGETYEFTDNLDNVIAGLVPKEWVQVIPITVIGYIMSKPFRSTYNKQFEYESPNIEFYGINSGTYRFKCVLTYQLKPNVNSGGELTGGHIYFLDNQGPVYDMFINEALKCICDYLYDLKENMKLPNLPMELFNRLPDASSKLKERLDMYYKQSLFNGDLII